MHGKKRNTPKRIVGAVNSNKPVPKFFPGGLLAAAPYAAQGLLGAGQAIFGGSQSRQAKDRLKELQRSAPNIEVPAAIRQLANEPIAEEFMEAQELGAQRRTARGIDALSRGGSRTLASLPSLMDNERIGEQQRAGQYEQARKAAMGQLGQAQLAVQDRKVDQYQRETDAARTSLEAGQQNIFGGFGQMGRGLTFGAINEDTRGIFDKQPMTFGDIYEEETINLSPKPRPFAKGGKLPPMKTKGKFDHETNEKSLVDDNTGEVEAKLTGQEVVLNEDHYNTMKMLVKEGKDDELLAFVKETFAKFEKS